MPIIKSAKKALKQNKKKAKQNLAYKKQIKKALKSKNLDKIYKALDKAAKRGVISKKKATRKKSQAALAVQSSLKNQDAKKA